MRSVSDPITPEVLEAFDHLCEREPRLKILYEDATAVQDDRSKPSFCANDVWYGGTQHEGLKDRLIKLVGHGAGREEEGPEQEEQEPQLLTIQEFVEKVESTLPPRIKNFPPELLTSDAYDVAYCVIYNALPDCRNCGCFSL